MESLQQEFDKKGYVVVDDVFSPQEVQTFIETIDKLGEGKNDKTWTINDGVVKTEVFWDVICHPKLLKAARSILGEDVKFCQHNDLQFGYSSFAWHRDSINRQYDPNLPDWQEDKEPYRIARAGIYLQPEEHNFHFGVVPGSHKPSGFITMDEFMDDDKYLSIFHNLKSKAGVKDVLKERADWIKTAPGKVVFFDPRLIHTGGEFEGEKYSFFIAYGIENQHFYNHYSYYRYMRYDLKYQPMPAELVSLLKQNDLYVEEKQYVKKLKKAFVPNKAMAKLYSLFNND